MNNREKINEILNKQFKAKPYAGYDPQDVDAFFDGVIDYLKSNDLFVQQTNEKLVAATNKISDLNQLIKDLESQLAKANDKIAQLNSDGYNHVAESSGYKTIISNANKGKK